MTAHRWPFCIKKRISVPFTGAENPAKFIKIMGNYKFPPKVKLVIGLLGSDRSEMDTTRHKLRERLGLEEEVLEPIPFIWTQYYQDELGDSPLRSFVSYETLVEREELVSIKRWTNEIEIGLSRDGKRSVNLDPGYLTLGQFFLATTKDQRQRVYVGNGIYVEPTLYYQDGAFKPFDWTYPDYRSEEYHGYFQRARAKLVFQSRNGGTPYSQRKNAPPPHPARNRGES